MSEEAALQVTRLAKRYGATIALADASLTIASGEVHAILGENGAGKSTLVKILSGVVKPDSGTLSIDGQSPPPFRSINDARKAGIATAFQELSLLPNLTVAQNLLLPALPRGPHGLTSRRDTAHRARETLARFGVTDIDVDTPVESLALATRQRLEIVRAFSHAQRVLVLDEPSAALADTTWLFEQIRQIANTGIAVIYISHRLGEVRSLCNRATVLRNGRSIDSVDIATVSDSQIFEMMVGHSPNMEVERADVDVAEDTPVLEVRGLHSGRIHDVSLDLHRGEVVGVAALEGQGQRQLFHALVGLNRVDAGEIRIDGQPTRLRSSRHARQVGPGIAFVPEERKTEGIFSGMRAAANITLPRALRMSTFGLINHGLERRHARAAGSQVDLQARYLDFRIDALSGGNQQKAVMARALHSGAGILVLFDPTRGVDVGTKQSIYRVIREFAESGGAVLMYSSEIPELMQVCNRCLVLYQGRITTELRGANITEQALISGIVGHGADDHEVAAAS